MTNLIVENNESNEKKSIPMTPVDSRLFTIFTDLDSKIGFNFLKNKCTRPVKFNEISQQLPGNLKIGTLYIIKKIYPESYHLIRVEDDILIDIFGDYNESEKAVKRRQLVTKVNERRDTFKKLLDNFRKVDHYDSHGNDQLSDLDFKFYFKDNNYEGIIEEGESERKPSNKSKSTTNELRKRRIGMKCKVKTGYIEKKEMDKYHKTGKKLSLLDRIREKEKTKLLNKANIELRDQQVGDRKINSRMLRIYQVLYEQSPKFTHESISLTFKKMEQLLQDSSGVPMEAADVYESLRRLGHLLPDVTVTSAGSIELIKLGKLNRDHDLILINNRNRVVNQIPGKSENGKRK